MRWTANKGKDLLPQLSALLSEYEMSSEVYTFITDKMAQDEQAESVDNFSLLDDLRTQIARLNGKQKILLDSYLDQDIDRQTFLAKKSEILSEKKSLEESLANLQANQFAWLEPMRNWLETAKSICYLRANNDFDGQKTVLTEIFGLNLFLSNKTLTQAPNDLVPKTTFRKGAESGFCLWQELKILNQKIARESDISRKIPILVAFYAKARTHFNR